MPFIIAFILSVICCVSTHSLACAVPLFAVALYAQVCILRSDSSDRQHLSRLFTFTSLIYVLSSLIFSYSFGPDNSHILFDPQKYILTFINSTRYEFDWGLIVQKYAMFDDSNQLYGLYMQNMSAWANNDLGGSSVLFLTLCNTIFGIVTSLYLFKIIRINSDSQTAFKYAILFTALSPFLFYSCVVIRDIIITCFFTIATYIILLPYKSRRIILLLLLAVLAWGVRLFSGLFLLSFVFIYLFNSMSGSKKYIITLPILIIAGVLMASSLLESTLYEQTMDEMEMYSEFSVVQSDGGLTAKLSSLPFGIKQIALLLFSPIRPFPPFSAYYDADTFSRIFISTIYLINGLFWYFIFYNVAIGLFISRYWKRVSASKKVIFIASLIFLLANMAHPDIRRSMPVFPFLYLLYVNMNTDSGFYFPKKTINRCLAGGYLVLLLAYSIL